MSFNTASGIYALQQRHHQRVYLTRGYVSIPQAVFTRCNSVSGKPPPDRAKMANWKTSSYFPLFCQTLHERAFGQQLKISCYASIHAAFRVHIKAGKPHFPTFLYYSGFPQLLSNRNSVFQFSLFDSFPIFCLNFAELRYYTDNFRSVYGKKFILTFSVSSLVPSCHSFKLLPFPQLPTFIPLSLVH